MQFPAMSNLHWTHFTWGKSEEIEEPRRQLLNSAEVRSGFFMRARRFPKCRKPARNEEYLHYYCFAFKLRNYEMRGVRTKNVRGRDESRKILPHIHPQTLI